MFTVFSYLVKNVIVFITLFQKSMWQLFKTDPCSMLEDNVYNFETNCPTDQVQLLLKVWHLTK